MDESKNKAKRLKLEENEFVCPKCKTILVITDELISEQYIQCDKCESVLENPLIKSNKGLIKNKKHKYSKDDILNLKILSLLVVIIVVGYVYYKYINDYNDSVDEEVNLSEDEGSIDYTKPISIISLIGEDGKVISTSTINTYSDDSQVSKVDYEYSEVWRKKAYEATKGYLKYILKKEHPDCHLSGLGYYNPSRVKYIGDKGFRVSLYYEFKCGSDSYKNRKNIWYEAYYDEESKKFKFVFIKDRFTD